MHNLFRIIFILFSFICFATAQQNQMHNINLQSAFLYELPGGDLRSRFGPDTKFEFKLEYLSKKWYAFYLKGGIRVNRNVKEDVLSILRTEEGFIIGTNGFYADVFGRKRGYDMGLGMDKLVPYKEHSFRAGISFCYATHWINFIDDSQAVPQISGSSSQFFDRFAHGFGLEENLQFQYHTSSNRAAFLIGLQIGQFFTNETRVSLQSELSERRLDLYFGVKFTYLLPLYSFGSGETVYY